MRKLLYPIVAVFVLALPAPGLAATIAIKATATGFSPKTVTINQGDAVKWTNVDKVNHQIVANNGAFASGILKPNETYSFTFNTAGKYGFGAAAPVVPGADALMSIRPLKKEMASVPPRCGSGLE